MSDKSFQEDFDDDDDDDDDDAEYACDWCGSFDCDGECEDDSD